MASSLSDARVLGGIGSALLVLAVVPSIGWVLSIAGLVMVLVAINNISEVVGDKKIFRNALIAILMGIGTIAVAALTIVGVAFHLIEMGSFVGSRFVFPSDIPFSHFTGVFTAVIAGLVVIWAVLIASAVFVRRSLNLMASKLNVHLFETAGLFYLIGAATAVILVGFVLIFVAEILLAISFFSIRERHSGPQTSQVQNVAPSLG